MYPVNWKPSKDLSSTSCVEADAGSGKVGKFNGLLERIAT